VLNLYPAYVARHYYLLVVVVALGVIQAAASVAGLRGLQIGGRLWRREFAWGALCLCLAGGAARFVVATPDYLSPGLAGTELIAMFGAGTMTALALSLAGGLLCPAPGRWRAPAPQGQQPLVGGCYCRLERPPETPRGLVVLLPDPDLAPEAVAPTAAAVVRSGFACGLVSWADDSPVYPDALAYVPMAVSRCGHCAGPQPAMLVVIGFGLAGDLALRAACEDEHVSLVLAIAPALGPQSISEGLLLLREMSLPEAWRWRRRWGRRAFAQRLRAGEALARLRGRAALCLSHGDGFFQPDGVIGEAALCGTDVRFLSPCSHQELVLKHAPRLVSEWLARSGEADAASAR